MSVIGKIHDEIFISDTSSENYFGDNLLFLMYLNIIRVFFVFSADFLLFMSVFLCCCIK